MYLGVTVPVPLRHHLGIVGCDLFGKAFLVLSLEGFERSNHPRESPLLGLGQVSSDRVTITPVALSPRIHDGTRHLRLTRLLGTGVDKGVEAQTPIDRGEEVVQYLALVIFQGQRLAGLWDQILLLDDLNHRAVRLAHTRPFAEIGSQRLVVPKHTTMLVLIALTDKPRPLFLGLGLGLSLCFHAVSVPG